MFAQLPARASSPPRRLWLCGSQQLHPPAAPGPGVTVAPTWSLLPVPLMLDVHSSSVHSLLLGCHKGAQSSLSSGGWLGLVTADTCFDQYFWVVFPPIPHSKHGREGETPFTINKRTTSQKHITKEQKNVHHSQLLTRAFLPTGTRASRELFSGMADP